MRTIILAALVAAFFLSSCGPAVSGFVPGERGSLEPWRLLPGEPGGVAPVEAPVVAPPGTEVPPVTPAPPVVGPPVAPPVVEQPVVEPPVAPEPPVEPPVVTPEPPASPEPPVAPPPEPPAPPPDGSGDGCWTKTLPSQSAVERIEKCPGEGARVIKRR